MVGMLPSACLLVWTLALVGTSRAQLHETSLSSRLRSKVPEFSKDTNGLIGSLEEIDAADGDTAEASSTSDVTLHNFLEGTLRTRWKAISSVGNKFDNRRRTLPMWDNITQTTVTDFKECFGNSDRRRMMDPDKWPYGSASPPPDWGDVECAHRRRYSRRRVSADVQPHQLDPPSSFVSALYLEPSGRTYSVSANDFNQRLQRALNPIIMRLCASCNPFYKTLFYRRFTYLNNFEAYDYMACNWNPDKNQNGVDFKIYNLLADALNDVNPWQSCSNATGSGVGFPGDCGNQSEYMLRVGGQWNSIPTGGCAFHEGGQTDVQFFILEANADVKARQPMAPTQDQMIAWFKSEDIQYSNTKFSWPSSVNFFTATSGNGSLTDPGSLKLTIDGNQRNTYNPDHTFIRGLLPDLEPTHQLFGASNPVAYLSGSTSDKVKFGTIISKNFTVCAVTRYTGSTTSQCQRIMQGSDTNWLLGHYMGSTGVAHFDDWVTPAVRNQGSQKWVVMCGAASEAMTFVGGGLDLSPNSAAQALGINIDGGCKSCKGQNSDFGVMEVIAWNKTLNATEIRQAISYLNWRLEYGTGSAIEPSMLTSPNMLSNPSVPPYALNFPLNPTMYFSGRLGIRSGSWQISSSVGGTITCTAGTCNDYRVLPGFGALNNVNFLQGDTTTKLTFPGSWTGAFTICSVTRYVSASDQQSILVSSTTSGVPQIIHGHFQGNVGVAKYGTVDRTATSRNLASQNWLVFCGGTGVGAILDGILDVSVPAVFPSTGLTGVTLGINTAGIAYVSKFALTELMVWNRQLSLADMQTAALYLLWELSGNTNR